MNTTVYLPNVNAAPTIQDAMLSALNAQRQVHGSTPLAHDDGLTIAAQQWADYLRDTGAMTHGDLGERISRNYPDWRAYAENIAAGFDDVDEVVGVWMRSAGHRRNMLDARLQDVGVGYATGGVYVRYFVVDFGAR